MVFWITTEIKLSDNPYEVNSMKKSTYAQTCPLAAMTDQSPWRKQALEKMKRNVKGQVQTIYDETVHVDMVIEMIGQGYTVASFCLSAGIHKSTFYEWLKTHDRFNEAYELALIGAESVNDDLLLWHPTMNLSVWGSRQHVFRKRDLEGIEGYYGKDLPKRLDATLEAADNGLITEKACLARIQIIQETLHAKEQHKEYENTYGKDGIKDIEKMNATELVEYITMMAERSEKCQCSLLVDEVESPPC